MGFPWPCMPEQHPHFHIVVLLVHAFALYCATGVSLAWPLACMRRPRSNHTHVAQSHPSSDHVHAQSVLLAALTSRQQHMDVSSNALYNSYKGVQGRSHSVEERTSTHSYESHATNVLYHPCSDEWAQICGNPFARSSSVMWSQVGTDSMSRQRRGVDVRQVLQVTYPFHDEPDEEIPVCP